MATVREYQSDGTFIDRDATADEIALSKADEKAWKLEQKMIQDKESARSALLEKLGITADEAAILLK
jgi:hypothetical protein